MEKPPVHSGYGYYELEVEPPRFFFPLTSGTLKERTGKLRKERAGDESCTLHTI